MVLRRPRRSPAEVRLRIPDREEHAKEIQIEMIYYPAHTENYNYEFDFSARRPTSLWDERLEPQILRSSCYSSSAHE